MTDSCVHVLNFPIVIDTPVSATPLSRFSHLKKYGALFKYYLTSVNYIYKISAKNGEKLHLFSQKEENQQKRRK